MTNQEPIVIHNAPDFHRVRTKYKSIPKRTRSKMKRAVKRGAIRTALTLGHSLADARLAHKKSWHFHAAERRAKQ